jgi:DNA helicase II / ATP-dependent DNA helicase PcrA
MSIRMPSYSQLSKEQLAILEDPVFGQNMMVIGPPGTGKTVIAMWRAFQTAKGTDTDLLMYNNILVSYSKQWDEEGYAAVGVRTYHKWVYALWGSKFRSKPPNLPQDKYRFDWVQMVSQLMDSKIDVGHLVVDEGQDLPIEFYSALGIITNRPGSDSSVCVAADENQRLSQDKNSSLKEIESALRGLGEIEMYTLEQNYRNTRQIAELANQFYVGVSTGIAGLPENTGAKPVLKEKSDINAMIDEIVTWMSNNEKKSCLVIGHSGSLTKKCFNKLKHRLAMLPQIKVEGYSSEKRFKSNKGAMQEKPEFHTGQEGTVTCIHWRSMKGLEADAVFIPEFEQLDLGKDGSDDEKMRMYVMFSRARTTLVGLYSEGTPTTEKMLALMNEAGALVDWPNR